MSYSFIYAHCFAHVLATNCPHLSRSSRPQRQSPRHHAHHGQTSTLVQLTHCSSQMTTPQIPEAWCVQTQATEVRNLALLLYWIQAFLRQEGLIEQLQPISSCPQWITVCTFGTEEPSSMESTYPKVGTHCFDNKGNLAGLIEIPWSKDFSKAVDNRNDKCLKVQ